jgi:hypothetical protein
MNELHVVVGSIAIALNAAACLLGAWCWWRVRLNRWFWPLLRTGQASVVVEAVFGGIVILIGHKPPGLHVLYGVLPVLVAFIAEQFKISSAQMVLDGRGFESAKDVGKLPEEEQHVIAMSIVQREVAVMTLAALVVVVLLGRAAMTG